MRTVALIALALCAACADLPDIDGDGCGNLVINAEEDCDGFADLGEGTACGAPDSDNACFFVCDAASGAVCPDGWGCGGDGRCRRPSGAFAEATGSPWRFAVQDFDIGDVDGDGNEDLVGSDVSALTLRFGSSDGQFAADLDVLTPQAKGPVTVARFDDDALADVVVPMAGGLFVALGSEERDLLPVAYAPFSLGDIGANGVGGVVLESIGGDLNSEVVVMIGNTMTFLNSSAGLTPMPTGFDVTDLAGRIPVADLDQDGERMEMAMAFAGDDQVFLFTSTGTQVGEGNNLQVTAYPGGPIGLPAGLVVQFGALFADVDGDADPDLMISVRNTLTSESRVAVALNTGGVLGAALPRTVFDRGNGSSPWPLAAGDLNGDGKADYVFAEGVSIADFGGAPPGIPVTLTPTAFAVGEPWGEAALGDFNGDDVADVAAVIESSDGVDFLLGVTVNGNPAGFFNPFHVDTEEPPRSLRVGDFDGDFIHDVALVESGFGVQQDGVSVIFGDTAGGPIGPFEMGALGFVDVVEPISMVVSADTLDATTDLFVLSSSFPDRDAKAVAILFGSSSRRMLSPFSLSPPVTVDNPNPEPDTARRALVGEFNDAGEGILDIVAVSEQALSGGVDPDGASSAHMWRVAGEGGEGGLDAETAGFVDLPAPDQFHTACSVWDSGDLDGDGLHEVVGIDNSLGRDFSCFGFGLSPAGRLLVGTVNQGDPENPLQADIGELAGELRAVRDVVLRDLDGDGDVDLLAVFAGEVRGGSDGGVAASSGIGVIWNQDGGLDPAAMDSIDVGAAVFDADVIQLDDTGVPALIILAHGQVLMARLDPATAEFGEPTPVVDQNGDGRLEVGDVNADGVADFAYTSGSEVHVLLGLPAPPRGGGTVIGISEGGP